jgi:hypothetical protein
MSTAFIVAILAILSGKAFLPDPIWDDILTWLVTLIAK